MAKARRQSNNTITGIQTDISACVEGIGPLGSDGIESDLTTGTEVIDTAGAMSSSLVFTCPPGQGGRYFVAGVIEFNGSFSGDESCFIRIKKNGVTKTTGWGGSATANVEIGAQVMTLLDLVPGDTVTFSKRWNGISSASINGSVSIFKLTGTAA